MSISATSKVSSSVSVTKSGRATSVSSAKKQQVDGIDSENKIHVDVATDERESRQQHHQEKRKAEEDKKQGKTYSEINSYTPGAFEALGASGVYDEEKKIDTRKVGIYDNNQSIIKEDRTAHQYTEESLFDEIEIISEIDEFA